MAHGPDEPPAPADAAERRRAAAQAGFVRLQAQFLAGLPGRWAEIVEAPPGPLRGAALHRLAGAAGSFELTALGQAARAAEHSAGRDEALLRAVLAQIEAAGVTVR